MAKQVLSLFMVVFMLGTAQAVPLETYGHLPALEDVSLSPDGSRVAFLRTVAEERVVAAVSLVDGKPLGIVNIGDVKVRQVMWTDNQHLLIIVSETIGREEGWGRGRETFHILLFDLQTHQALPVPDANKVANSDKYSPFLQGVVVAGPPMVRRIDGKAVVFVKTWLTGYRAVLAVVRYDVESGETSVPVRSTGSVGDWMLDDNGHVAAEELFDQSQNHWVVRVANHGEMQKLAEGIEPIDIPHFLGFGPSGGTVVLEELKSGLVEWRTLPLRDGAQEPVLTKARSLFAPLMDRFSGRIIGGIRIDDDAQYEFFDAEVQRHWNSIVHAFPGAHVQFTSASEDYRKFVVRVEGPEFGYRYQFIDLDAHKARPLGDVYDGLTEPFEVKNITYTARDGMRIPAYLTLPRKGAGKSLPLVVLPHGGPAARDTADFDWWSQALADAGYAVLRPNYRGSRVTQDFMSAGYGQYGRKMQTDLSDGVAYLAKEGIIDPARVCIVGASYGGYAALAGVTLDPGVYRCAASVAGLSDLNAFLHWVDRRANVADSPQLRYWERYIGVTDIDDSLVSELSPVRKVDAVHVPILLIHGVGDTVVPYEQSQRMFDALTAAGREVRFVKLDGEDHWLSHGATRLQMLQEIVSFLRKNNPTDSVVPSTVAAAPTH